MKYTNMCTKYNFYPQFGIIPHFNLPHWKRRPRPQKTTPNPGDAGASPAGNSTVETVFHTVSQIKKPRLWRRRLWRRHVPVSSGRNARLTIPCSLPAVETVFHTVSQTQETKPSIPSIPSSLPLSFNFCCHAVATISFYFSAAQRQGKIPPPPPHTHPPRKNTHFGTFSVIFEPINAFVLFLNFS